MNSVINDDKTFCFKILRHVSRSFALVIEQLEEPLRMTVCVFYLVLRALDTIEDDSTMDDSIKLEALKLFPKYLEELEERVGHGWRFSCQNNNEYYIELMENFDKVLRVFNQCTSAEKKIIRDITDEMADGMMKYANRSIDTMDEYNEYCYYVAGLVGIGLTELIQSKCVLDVRGNSDNDLRRLAISTGTFLQKTNILRDIYEDLSQPTGRLFYPKEVWGKYVENARDLIDEKFQPQAIDCLNFLINDAFQHLPDSIEYLSLITTRTATFRFIAIPQVLAVGTLEKMFNNPVVFNSTVKLASTESFHIFKNVKDIASCLQIMKGYLSKLAAVVPSNPITETENWILRSLKFVENYQPMIRR